MLSATRLDGYRRSVIEKRLAAFVQAYLDLREYLHTPLGDIPLRVDNAQIQNLWHTFLIVGRELIDEIGSIIHICFSLQQSITGLNKKKMESLRKIIEQASRKITGLEPLTACLDEHQEIIENFVALRNRDKTKRDTLIDFPLISETGTPSGGLIANRETGFSFDFVIFVEKSYLSLIDFTKRILGVS